MGLAKDELVWLTRRRRARLSITIGRRHRPCATNMAQDNSIRLIAGRSQQPLKGLVHGFARKLKGAPMERHQVLCAGLLEHRPYLLRIGMVRNPWVVSAN